MPFGNKARHVRAYEFGCLPPVLGEDLAVQVMRKRNDLWNKLVEIDHKYKADKEAIVAPYITVPDDKEHRDEHKKQRHAAFKRDEVKALLAELEDGEYQEYKRSYQAAAEEGLYWGNYLKVTNDWQVARRKPMPLKFHSFVVEGQVSVQWPKGMPVSKVFDGSSNVLRLAAAEEAAYDVIQRRCVRRRLQRSKVDIRIASDERHNPIWLSLPCVLHRPLPGNGLIRSAAVFRSKIGTHWHWKLVVVVETPVEVKAPAGEGIIGIDIGWRKRPTGLRVAYWSDTQGSSGEVVLPVAWVEGMDKVDDLRSIRDKDFDDMRIALVAWLKSHDHPESLRSAAATLPSWKSGARLAGLAVRWRNERFASDEMIFGKLESWRKQDKHLLEWECNQREKLILDRRERYRLFAAWVVKNYDHAVIEDFDLRRVTKHRKKGGMADDLPPAARHQRFLAATSTLRLALKNACDREGVPVEEKEAAYTTLICNVCGSLERSNDPADVIWVCRECRDAGRTATYDQDENAAKNLIKPDFRVPEAIVP